MLVLKLCQQLCPERIPVTVGARLGDGADGEVFEIIGRPDRVIKFCVLYETGSTKLENTYKYTTRVLDHLITDPSPVFAHVYVHTLMGQYTRTVWGNKKQRYLLYYYMMEKLQKITEDERRVFDSIVSHEDRGKKKNFSPKRIKEMLSGMALGLDFDAEKVTFFCESFKKSPVAHLDIHPRNIMKDAAGNFKLIDFDRAEMNNGKGNKG
jgi:serine/threonine protein kinase